MLATALSATDLARQAEKIEALVNWSGMTVNVKKTCCDRNSVGPGPQKWQRQGAFKQNAQDGQAEAGNSQNI